MGGKWRKHNSGEGNHYSPHQLNTSKEFSKLNCFDLHHLQNQWINLGKSSNKDTNLFTFQGWAFQLVSLFNAFVGTTAHVEFKTESDERSLAMWSVDLKKFSMFSLQQFVKRINKTEQKKRLENCFAFSVSLINNFRMLMIAHLKLVVINCRCWKKKLMHF